MTSDVLLDCNICHDIWRRFADPTTTHKVNLGSSEDATSSSCYRHRPLLECFRDYCRRYGRQREESNDIGISAGYKGSSVNLTQSLSKQGIVWDLLLLKQDSVQNHVGTGRILDPDWVDLDIVKQWKSQCLSSHGAKCENPMKIWPTRPAWLIDIQNKCIIPGQGCAAFVALSYRWGEGSGYSIDLDSMAKLQQPNALNSPDIAANLPSIIRHAMYLTSVIGERYLWVDALCIVHGDSAATANQLNLMGAIYASAVITIIAADGDSQTGLPGLRHISAPRELEQRVIPFGEEQLIVQITGLFSMGNGTPYYERGWTYQEYYMSSRLVLFNQKELHWQCQCSVWHEEMTIGTEIDMYIEQRLQVMLAGFPDLGSLGNLIENYNKRELRYDEDAVPAISGLLSILSRSFTGGFLGGLPEMFFDRALGWKPHWSHTNLRRRIPSGHTAGSRSKISILPSWSWVGWQGLVWMGYGEAARINDRQSWIEETIPITVWYTSSSPSDSSLRRIRSTWFENRDTFKDFTKPLPAGWTCHKVPSDELIEDGSCLYPDGCSGHVFKHCNMPDEDCDSWYFPFPVTEIKDSTPPFTPEQTPYIFCETKKACLWAHQAGDYNMLILRNTLGDSIGKLHLHNQELLELFPETVGDDALGKQVQLVAIYRSRQYSKTFDKNQKRYTRPHEISEMYKVLWVEWEEGIAYRLASGHVERDKWEELDLKEVSLVLG